MFSQPIHRRGTEAGRLSMFAKTQVFGRHFPGATTYQPVADVHALGESAVIRPPKCEHFFRFNVYLISAKYTPWTCSLVAASSVDSGDKSAR